MIGLYIALAATPALALCAAVILAVLVVGIRKADRSDITSPPQTRLDAITRRVVGGSRSNGHRSGGNR